ncbi:RipA family octameric membrane protein [Pantoea eucalypti]|uniref:RipA family octameric membrane protein n=1 Tax=Pantoea eucalypti TaxID=470933 RepID=UPI0009998AB4|nr:hypothetical protein [Pantoea eucalypti]SJZ36355.1 hypothetical protein SAMN03097723_0762 [Pantoea eucalypti]
MLISRNIDYFELLLDKNRNHNGVINADNVDLEKIKVAFEKAHDIRKFEIGLYWQRSGYILGFLSVLSAAIAYCFSVYLNGQSPENTKFSILLITISLLLIGITLCGLWKRIIQASKYWQECWEYNIDMLEPYVSGNLHKIHFHRMDQNYNRFSIHDIVISICNRILFILYALIFVILAVVCSEFIPFLENIPKTKEMIYLFIAPLLLLYLLIDFIIMVAYRKSDKSRKKSRRISKENLKITMDHVNCSKDRNEN